MLSIVGVGLVVVNVLRLVDAHQVSGSGATEDDPLRTGTVSPWLALVGVALILVDRNR